MRSLIKNVHKLRLFRANEMVYLINLYIVGFPHLIRQKQNFFDHTKQI